MKWLLSWVKSNLIKERPEMFVKGDSVYGFFTFSAVKSTPQLLKIEFQLAGYFFSMI
jgi:hypothetical protein